jgi:hypothetical protein
MTIERLKELISQTHQHGVKLAAEIRDLEKKHTPGAKTKAAALRVYLHALEVLNKRRRAELVKLEHQKPSPAPKPKPQPPAPKPKPDPPKPKPQPAPQPFTMYDSTNVDNIPANAEAVAGYVNGAFANFDELVHRFPHAKHLSIAVTADVDADGLDIENGDATPAEAPGWVRKQHARGKKRPILYIETSRVAELIQILTDAGIKRDEYLIWTAHYTNEAHIEDGSDATQYEDHDELYDVSLCHSWFL